MSMSRYSALVFVTAAVAACGNGDKQQGGASKGTANLPTKATVLVGALDAGVSAVAPTVDAAPPMNVEPFEDSGNEKRALRKLGAIAVWDAVVDRGRYLARRNKAGAVWGRLGADVDGYYWLIDEKAGGGCLAIRVAFAKGMLIKEGDRLLVLGAWHVDDDKRWYWKPARVAKLKADKNATPFVGSPGHHIVELDTRPRKAIRVSEAVPNQGGEITFEVVSRPVRLGDGYRIADRTDWRSEGILILPGEREPYGAQDLLAPDERWTLKRRVQYTLKVAPFRPRWGKEPPTMRALTAPRRVVSSKIRQRRKRDAERAKKKLEAAAKPDSKSGAKSNPKPKPKPKSKSKLKPKLKPKSKPKVVKPTAKP